MKSNARVVEIFSAGVALFVSSDLIWAQSCQCDVAPAAAAQFSENMQQSIVPLYAPAPVRTAADSIGQNQKPFRQLPAGWPNQWGGPTIPEDAGRLATNNATKSAEGAGNLKTEKTDQKNDVAKNTTESAQKQNATSALVSSLMVRDPFSARMVPTSSQVRWGRGEETKALIGGPASGGQKAVGAGDNFGPQRSIGIASSVERKDTRNQSVVSEQASKESIGGSESSIGASSKSSTRSWSVLPAPGRAGGGAAIGGGSGGIGGGGGGPNAGIGGGNGGGGGGNGANAWTWNPQTGGAGGATGGGGGGQANTGVLGSVETVTGKTDPPANDPVDPPNNGPGEDPVDPPNNGPGENPVDPPSNGPGEDPVDPPNNGPGENPVDPPSNGLGEDPVDPPNNGPGEDPVDPPSNGPGEDPVDPPNNGPGEDPVDPPTSGPGDDSVNPPKGGHCHDLTDIPLPDPSIPDVTPDLPSGTHPSHCGVGHNTPPGGGDSPVVPEPGSIILIGIAGGVGGAGLIRRWLKKRKVNAT